MKRSLLRNLLNVGLLGAAMVLTMLFGSGLTPARAANPPETTPVVRPVKETRMAPLYAAGTLLRGSNRFVYYVTTGGTRRPLMDRETFLAALASVVKRFHRSCHTYCLMGSHFHFHLTPDQLPPRD